MTMKLRQLLAMCILALSTALLALPSQAVDLGGTGALRTKGSGIATLEGSGKTVIKGHGVLYINDVDADAMVHVTGDGRRIELPDGAVVYVGFRGKAEITGPTFVARLTGANIELGAVGRGRVRLEGCGHFVVNGDIHPWTKDGALVVLSSPTE